MRVENRDRFERGNQRLNENIVGHGGASRVKSSVRTSVLQPQRKNYNSQSARFPTAPSAAFGNCRDVKLSENMGSAQSAFSLHEFHANWHRDCFTRRTSSPRGDAPVEPRCQRPPPPWTALRVGRWRVLGRGPP